MDREENPVLWFTSFKWIELIGLRWFINLVSIEGSDLSKKSADLSDKFCEWGLSKGNDGVALPLFLLNMPLIESASSTKILIIFELLKLFSMLNLSIILITSSLGIKPTLFFLVGIYKLIKVQHLTIISVALYSL